MPTIPEIKEQLKALKKTHKEIRITGLNKSEMLLLLSKYTKVAPPEKAVKAVKMKKERKEQIKEYMKQSKIKSERKKKVENLAHNLDMVLKVNKIRKFANVVKEKLEQPKRVKKILDEVEAEVKSKHTRQKKLMTLQRILLQALSAKRVSNFLGNVGEKIVSKRQYSNVVFG
jgi:hypothetical protein